jgi:predicted nuclease of predicted toxin-antitoxin system
MIWLRIGNCPTGEIEALLRRHHAAILAFVDDGKHAILVLA